ncbi:MAG: ATP-dependent RNA helicase RhlE [Halieaceae bacterium]|jgi:ATP-dependent RNA helicase RhlE
MKTFSDLGFPETLLRAITEKGYTEPSPIQAQAIPLVQEGRDIMAAAQTGTGKTAGFALPILQRLANGTSAKSNRVRVLVLTPTRELAAQVQQSFETYGKYEKLSSAVVFGGVKINPQMMKLRKGVDVLVATPGRLLDLYNQKALRFDDLEVLVLDEADRMLDMGFIHDIKKIVGFCPTDRQTLMFSATFSKQIKELASGFLRNPAQVSVNAENTTADTVKQWIYAVDKKRKPELLSHLVRQNNWHQVLVFTRTKHGANKLTQQLEKDGIRAEAIHGNKSQNARTKALEGFKRGKVQALIATDIAARGLDIEQLPQVVNFDLPNIAEDYVHRIGRTGRAGSTGHAYSLVCADEADHLYGIEKLIRQSLPREEIEGFEPLHAIPQGKPSTGNRNGGNRGNGSGQGKRHNNGGNSQQRRRPGGNRAA